MTPKKTAEQIESKSLKAIEKLNKVIISVQDNAYGEVVVVLKKLQLDKEGYILQTNENRNILRETNRAFSNALGKPSYVNGLNQFTVAFHVVDEINAQYFESLDGFKINKQFMKSMQRQAIADIESMLLNEGLESQIKTPLLQILNQNINSGGSFTGLMEQVRDYIKGNESTDGRLLKYSKQITKDVLFNYSRTYQQAVASDLGLEFYLYVGGVIRSTRDWCREKAGNFFHQKEIESWADEDWSGKRFDTTKSSIFIYAGGHGCLHQILPVSVAIVPEDVIVRATSKGFYKNRMVAVTA